MIYVCVFFFFFQAEDGIRDLVRSRGLGDVYKRQEYVDSQNILISMDGRGRATDNIFIERLWRTVKRDYIYIRPADNGTELFKGLNTFFDYYNNKKTHQGIDRCIPAYLYKKVA